jgi:hypothetical protein
MPPKQAGIFFNKSITFRISEADYTRLKNDAEIAGISVSDLIRKRFHGKKIKARVDLILINELRRLGGLLKHNFSALREGQASQELMLSQEETLEKIKNLITNFRLK